MATSLRQKCANLRKSAGKGGSKSPAQKKKDYMQRANAPRVKRKSGGSGGGSTSPSQKVKDYKQKAAGKSSVAIKGGSGSGSGSKPKSENKPAKPAVSAGRTAFNKAFAKARKEGKKVFSWRGKRYSTKLK